MMHMRPGTLAAAVIIVVVGFAIGGWLAIHTRGPAEPTTRVTVATRTAAAQPIRTLAPRPVQTLAPTATPAARVTAPTIATPEPVTATAAALAIGAAQGAWQLVEANVQVGTIVWVGDAAPEPGNAIAFTLHKQSVGGRPAVPCERQTRLHASFSPTMGGQTVPYREVNCDGVVSTGEVRITTFSRKSVSFSGSFWHDGVNLGNFTARKL